MAEFATRQYQMDQSLLDNDGNKSEYTNTPVPAWNAVQNLYAEKWAKEKEKFQTELKNNFFALIERFASGKQEVFLLSVPDRRAKLYEQAFLELFESGYAPHIGDSERLSGRKVKRLYITLPHNFCD
jgi:hypothetical protein